LYGTTQQGGTFGYGTIFELNPTGTETVLYNFTGKSDGGFPSANVVRDSDGNLYSTAIIGGKYGNGVVFKFTTSGSLVILHSFCASANCADGLGPNLLLRDSTGNLYVVSGNSQTVGGTLIQYGIVSKIMPKGSFSVFHTFCKGAVGQGCANGVD